MPTDPKWRVVARKSGQRIGDVIAVFNFLLVSGSANASERGRTHGFDPEDVAAALDLETADVEAILAAMQGKVLDGDRLTGWDKRQPKREDNSALRAKQWRDERKRTQANAEERPETDTETDIPLAKANGSVSDLGKTLFDLGVAAITAQGVSEPAARSFLAKAQKAHGDPAALEALNLSLRSTDIRSRMTAILNAKAPTALEVGVPC